MAPSNKLNVEYKNNENTVPSAMSPSTKFQLRSQFKEPCLLVSQEELLATMNFKFEPISNIEELLYVGPIVLNTIINAEKVHNTSDEHFKFDHDPVPFLEQLLDEYDAQEAEELFEYDINPVLFLEKLLNDEDDFTTHKESDILLDTPQELQKDEEFVFDHDPVPFLEELLAEYDTQEAEEFKSLKVYEDIIVPADDTFNESFVEYNGESICFYNSSVTDISALEESMKCQKKLTKSVGKDERNRTSYIKSRTFINSKLHCRN